MITNHIAALRVAKTVSHPTKSCGKKFITLPR
nr:MAG TPA: hypothetical protein [Caudoviricetes sp.]